MIRLNPAMFDQITYNNLGHTSFMNVLYVFDGAYDFDAIIQDAANSSATGYDLASIIAQINSAGSNVVGQVGFEIGIIAERLNETNIKFPLSESVYEIEKLSNNPAGWFMFAITNSGYSETSVQSKALTATQLFIGSVGDIGSGADMEIPGAAFDPNIDYKATDLEFELV